MSDRSDWTTAPIFFLNDLLHCYYQLETVEYFEANQNLILRTITYQLNTYNKDIKMSKNLLHRYDKLKILKYLALNL